MLTAREEVERRERLVRERRERERKAASTAEAEPTPQPDTGEGAHYVIGSLTVVLPCRSVFH